VRLNRKSSKAAGVLLAASAVLAPMALAGAGERTVESEPFTLAGDNLTTKLVKCGEGSQLTGGGLSITPTSAMDIGTRVKSLFPVGDRKWYTVIDNLQPVQRQAKGYALCRKGHQLTLETGSAQVDGSVEQRPDVTAKCPKGSSVTGGGAALTGSHNDSFVMESRPEGDRGWYIRTFISSTFTGEQAAYAICDPDKSNKYKSVAKVQPPPPLAASRRGTVVEVIAKAKCPRGAVTTGGGYATRDDPNRSVIENRPKGERTWLGQVRTYNANEGFTAWSRCLLG
jgi:hypothetical protein